MSRRSSRRSARFMSRAARRCCLGRRDLPQSRRQAGPSARPATAFLGAGRLLGLPVSIWMLIAGRAGRGLSRALHAARPAYLRGRRQRARRRPVGHPRHAGQDVRLHVLRLLRGDRRPRRLLRADGLAPGDRRKLRTQRDRRRGAWRHVDVGRPRHDRRHDRRRLRHRHPLGRPGDDGRQLVLADGDQGPRHHRRRRRRSGAARFSSASPCSKWRKRREPGAALCRGSGRQVRSGFCDWRRICGREAQIGLAADSTTARAPRSGRRREETPKITTGPVIEPNGRKHEGLEGSDFRARGAGRLRRAAESRSQRSVGRAPADEDSRLAAGRRQRAGARPQRRFRGFRGDDPPGPRETGDRRPYHAPARRRVPAHGDQAGRNALAPAHGEYRKETEDRRQSRRAWSATAKRSFSTPARPPPRLPTIYSAVRR